MSAQRVFPRSKCEQKQCPSRPITHTYSICLLWLIGYRFRVAAIKHNGYMHRGQWEEYCFLVGSLRKVRDRRAPDDKCEQWIMTPVPKYIPPLAFKRNNYPVHKKTGHVLKSNFNCTSRLTAVSLIIDGTKIEKLNSASHTSLNFVILANIAMQK